MDGLDTSKFSVKLHPPSQTKPEQVMADAIRLHYQRMKTKKAPILSVAGLVILAITAIWAVYVMTELSHMQAQTDGYEGFVVIAVLTVTTPIAFLCAIIGLVRRERPSYIPWIAVIISSVPIVAVLAKAIIQRST